jgi:hypothetical protein
MNSVRLPHKTDICLACALQYFSNAGWLFPKYNLGYWLGLTNRSLPDGNVYDFQWLDPHSPGPDYSTYSNWGSNDATQEPHDNGAHQSQ